MANQAEKGIYEFPPFRLDTVKRRLLREGANVTLTPKAFELLRVLVENRDRVMTKDELLAAVWPDAIVEEGNLAQNVSLARKALGEQAGVRSYIVTVPGRGYRFVADVGETAATQVTAPPPETVVTKDEVAVPPPETVITQDAPAIPGVTARDIYCARCAGNSHRHRSAQYVTHP